jgi:hypothetical protein
MFTGAGGAVGDHGAVAHLDRPRRGASDAVIVGDDGDRDAVGVYSG